MKMVSWRAACAFALVAGLATAPAQADDGSGQSRLTRAQRHLLSGQADLMLNGGQEARLGRPARGADGGATRADNQRPFYFPSEDDLCPQQRGDNVKVNADCQNLTDADLQGRAQAQNEPAISYDPTNPRHLVTTFNDYRRGDGNCGGSFSVDGGQSWANIVVPMSFTRAQPEFGQAAARQYWQAGGDTSVAWDTKGNAYFSCQVFNRGAPTTTNQDQSSAFLVFRSTGNDGGSWNFPGRYVTTANDRAGTGTILEDKQYLTVDNHPGSPFQDRVYVSWTEFAPDGTASIYLAYSNDFGETFSPRRLVSLPSAPLCPTPLPAPAPGAGACDANQFSQPFTGPDGTLYVAYANVNNPGSLATRVDQGDEDPAGSFGPGAPPPGGPPPAAVENRNQMLLSRSTDGGNTFSGPIKIADYYDLPDCPTYQQGKDVGRACVPEKGATANSFFRAVNYPSGAVNPTDPSQVVVTFGSYINKFSNETRPNPCVPTAFNPTTGNNLFYGVKTPDACNNKILVSVSNDSGVTFTGTTVDPRLLPTVNQAPRQVGTDQWWQWAAFTPDGRLAVSYYDRQYGDDEATGYSDVTISGSRNLADFGVQRVTSGSMPPPTEFSGLFWGDYSGLAAPDNAYPIWSDTRNPELFLCPGTGVPGSPPAVCNSSAANAPRANDQDVFTQGVPIPLSRGDRGRNR